jgi:hypothetical protein
MQVGGKLKLIFHNRPPARGATRGRRRAHPEQDFQASLVRDLAVILTPDTFFFAVPNGGFRTKAEAGILIGQGVKPGVPDLIFIYGGRAFGLELKAKKRGLSRNQKETIPRLQRAGMVIGVARTLDEAIAFLRANNIPLPAGCHLCRPEICWSAGREYIYFTYAELMPKRWMEVRERSEEPKSENNVGVMNLEGGIKVERNDGTIYYRKTLPFNFWNVKSEASVTRDHHAVYVDKADEAVVKLLVDYMFVEGWSNPLPPRAEYREIDGSYGRGFRPIYLKPGDWIAHEEVPHGHDNLGKKDLVRVISDSEMTALRAR